MVDNCLEFGVGVDAETDLADYNVAVGPGVERLHREVEGIGDTIHKVNKKVAAVNGPNSQCDGIESLVSFEINRHYIVTV